MAAPHPTTGLVRATLGNGLRVLIAAQPGTAVVAVAVHYGVGYRSEPPDRPGFAHLFEHLMFQGSERFAKLAHFRHIQSSGGTCNAVTARDHTCYHQTLPARALERALVLEADRMRAPRFTQDNLANQVAVIRSEIGANVRGRPYGGLPWLLLPPVLFDKPANTHDGYGAIAGLATATVADCEAFFDNQYAPANAVLTVTGDVEPDDALESVRRLFAPIAARPAPAHLDLDEPPMGADREQTHDDPLAPLPATAVGWRLPPDTDRRRIDFAVLAALLTDGPNAALHATLVRTGTATHVSAVAGLTPELLGSRDPDAFVATAMHSPVPGAAATADRVLHALDRELARLRDHGPDPDTLRRTALRVAAERYRRLGRPGDRAQLLGMCEILHERAELAVDLAEQATAVDADAVAAAAGHLAAAGRAVLQVRTRQPGTGRTA